LDFLRVAEYYNRLESTTSRIEMTRILSSLFLETPKDEIAVICYLTQGKLRPDYEGVELGVAEKLALRAMSTATGLSLEKVTEIYVKLGDIGNAAEKLISQKAQYTLFSKPLTLMDVYNSLMKISRFSGEGSQDAKLRELVGLLNNSTPIEAKYIMRIVTGQLRLGVADYTILDAAAESFLGSKDLREEIERAYNLHPDLGYVVEKAAREGINGIKSIRLQIGIPVRPMLAERLESAIAIFEKLGKRELAAEYKLDGERLQIHKKGETVILFSRRLEVITSHYPDAVDLVRRYLRAEKAVVEGEVVAINEDTGEYLPFQELMHRRRKYGIEQAMKDYPVSINLFDVLLLEDKELVYSKYRERRETLEKIVERSERMIPVPMIMTSDPETVERYMQEAIANGCEGLVVKDPDSVYRAGAREFAWIKLKREYRSELTDTLDLVIVGGFHGKGRRAGTYGTYLLAAYDDKRNVFSSVAKIGTGFSDEDLRKIPEILKDYEMKVKPEGVESKIEPDVWFRPFLVIEVIASEITLSPTHTAAWDRIRKGTGLSLRFPKFTGRIRDDKSPEEATTVDELVEMYNRQLKKIEMETQ
jgi:DNA ligase-1